MALKILQVQNKSFYVFSEYLPFLTKTWLIFFSCTNYLTFHINILNKNNRNKLAKTKSELCLTDETYTSNKRFRVKKKRMTMSEVNNIYNEPRTVTLVKTDTGFGFNVRGQVSEGGQLKVVVVERLHSIWQDLLNFVFITSDKSRLVANFMALFSMFQLCWQAVRLRELGFDQVSRQRFSIYQTCF